MSRHRSSPHLPPTINNSCSSAFDADACRSFLSGKRWIWHVYHDHHWSIVAWNCDNQYVLHNINNKAHAISFNPTSVRHRPLAGSWITWHKIDRSTPVQHHIIYLHQPAWPLPPVAEEWNDFVSSHHRASPCRKSVLLFVLLSMSNNHTIISIYPFPADDRDHRPSSFAPDRWRNSWRRKRPSGVTSVSNRQDIRIRMKILSIMVISNASAWRHHHMLLHIVHVHLCCSYLPFYNCWCWTIEQLLISNLMLPLNKTTRRLKMRWIRLVIVPHFSLLLMLWVDELRVSVSGMSWHEPE